jgi:hypothetical protein
VETEEPFFSPLIEKPPVPAAYSGSRISSAGDVNGDGLDDLIIGATGVNNDTGRSYVVFGKINSTAINLSSIPCAEFFTDTVIDFSVLLPATSVATMVIVSAGDVNGDGLDDLIIGAFLANIGNRANAGKSYVVFGKTNTATINLSATLDKLTAFVLSFFPNTT